MSKRKIISLGCAMILGLGCLTGCVSDPVEEKQESLPTLPPAAQPWEAPERDRIGGEEGIWTLYLPGKNGLSLVPQHIPAIPGALLEERMEETVRELLSFSGNSQADSLGKGTELTLFGEYPVEYSGGIVTVNLGSPALSLSYRDFYTLSLALASTLCEIDSVRCVNVLVADRSVGLDTTGSLAMGSVISHPGENIPVLWAERVGHAADFLYDAVLPPGERAGNLL